MKKIQKGVRLGVLAIIALAWLSGDALGAQQRSQDVLGANVRVMRNGGIELRGELLAARPDGVWLLDERGSFRAVPFEEIRQVRMQRHGWSSGRIARWSLIGGGLTSVAMFAACTSERPSGSCGAFALGWAAAWAAVGGVAGLIIQPTRSVEPAALDQLRPWARFPQGIPEGYRPGSPSESSGRNH